ncbi:MAG: DinB family protein [Armatimonadota bacterium]|nr:DinB family protein [Armatimonadota bacterium]MDR5697647.1 DinB family protein [Armatimonadota bacterium]
MVAPQAVRRHLLWLLRGGDAHASFDRAVRGLPVRLHGVRPAGLPYSPWGLIEHMRTAQWDILEFTRNPDHRSPPWPAGYWPSEPAPADVDAWRRSVAAFRADLRAMQHLVADPATDLFAPIPHGQGQTVLREALLVANHNAYHVGQLIVVRRLLGAWAD